MKLKRFIKKVIASALAFSLFVASIPHDFVVKAAASDNYPDEIVFPITVLDFKQDNLLFEYLGTWQNGQISADGIDFSLVVDPYRKYNKNHPDSGDPIYIAEGLVEDELPYDKETGTYGLPVYKEETLNLIANYLYYMLTHNFGLNVLDNPDNPMSMRNYILPTGLEAWVSFEAEAGQLAAGAVLTDSANCSNDTYVGNIGGETNGTVTFQMDDCKQAGMHTIRLYYASDEQRSFELDINGTTYTLQCADNGSWDTPVDTPIEVQVYLAEGSNTIKVGGLNGGYAPNLDWIEVSNWYSYEAEDGKLFGGARIGDSADCSNGKYVYNLGFIENWSDRGSITHTVNVKEAGTYQLNVYYATDDDRYLNVILNGTSLDGNGFFCRDHGSWTNPNDNPLTIEVELNAGENTIEFTDRWWEQYAPNIDRFELVKGKLDYPLGTYEESKNKIDGNPNFGLQNIETCMDYAYFVTKNLFNHNATLNMPYNDYNSLIFHKLETDGSGIPYYEFMADQNNKDVDLIYNSKLGTVRNALWVPLEAEDGVLAGGTVIRGNNNCSNDRYVENIGGNGNGTVTFEVKDCNKEGIYTIRLYYTSNVQGNYQIIVNDKTDNVKNYTVACKRNNSWVTPVEVDVYLVEGTNTIQIGGMNGSITPNLDWIEIGSKAEDGDVVRDGGSLFICDDLVKENPELDPDVCIKCETKKPCNCETPDYHSFNFTISSQSMFVYQEGGDQYFHFSGDDDVYVYVNGKLVLDLGGAHQQADKSINLDELYMEQQNGGRDYGLAPGEEVHFAFFYMERRSTAANFYARLNFKLSTDNISHDFDYKTIPYGFMVDLDYSFSSRRELNTNKNITFTDGFGNKIGAEGIVLGSGCYLEPQYKERKDENGNPVLDENGNPELITYYRIRVTLTRADGTVEVEDFIFNSKNDLSGDELEVLRFSEFFKNIEIKKGDSFVITGLQYDTSTKAYTDSSVYKESAEQNKRILGFSVDVTYDAWMHGAMVPTKGSSTYDGSVAVIVGSIELQVSDESHKDLLFDFGDFTISRDEDNKMIYHNDIFTNGKLCKHSSPLTNPFDVSNAGKAIIINEVAMGNYTLTLDKDVLTSYEVTIKGIINDGIAAQEVTVDGASNDGLTLKLEPIHERVYLDAEKTNYEDNWTYPKIIFELKAIRDLPGLSDLT